MTHAQACALPPCPCGMPTVYRETEGRISCTSGICDWSEAVEPPARQERPCCRECGCTRAARCCVHGKMPAPEPLRAPLGPKLRAALRPLVPEALARQAAALAPLLRPAPPDDDTAGPDPD